MISNPAIRIACVPSNKKKISLVAQPSNFGPFLLLQIHWPITALTNIVPSSKIVFIAKKSSYLPTHVV